MREHRRRRASFFEGFVRRRRRRRPGRRGRRRSGGDEPSRGEENKSWPTREKHRVKLGGKEGEKEMGARRVGPSSRKKWPLAFYRKEEIHRDVKIG